MALHGIFGLFLAMHGRPFSLDSASKWGDVPWHSYRMICCKKSRLRLDSNTGSYYLFVCLFVVVVDYVVCCASVFICCRCTQFSYMLTRSKNENERRRLQAQGENIIDGNGNDKNTKQQQTRKKRK